MKKYIGAFASALAGILTFVFLSLDGIFRKASAAGLSTSSGTSGWDIIKDENGIYANADGYTLYKVAAIILLVLACLLIISAVVIILRNLKVFKSKVKFNALNNLLLVVNAICAILVFVGACVMGGNMSVGETIKVTAGVGSWLVMVTGVVTCALGCLFARDTKK